MQQTRPYNDKLLLGAGLMVLMATILAYFATVNYAMIAIPFAFLYLVLIGINWKTAYWIFLFTIPASVHFDLMGDALAISLPDEPLMWIFLLLFVVLLITQRKLIPEWWWRNPIVFIVVLQLLWLMVAVAYSQVFIWSFKFLLAKLWFLACFFVLPVVVFKTKKDLRTGFWVMFIPILVTSIIIFIRHAMIRFDFVEIKQAIGKIYYNHVDYSTVLSMFFPILCVAYPLTKGKPKWLRVGLLLVITYFLVAIFFTYARAAMIAVVFAGVVALAIRIRMVNYIMPVFYGCIAALLVYLAHDNKYFSLRPDYSNTYMHFSFTDHMIATFRGQDMSSMERVYRWIAAVRMSTDKPITGYGPHAFYYYYKPYAIPAFRTYVSRNDEHSTTHNYFLFMLVEQGWPAMLLYAILVMVVFAQAQKTYHRFKDRFYKYATLGLAMMFAASFVNNFFSELIETHKVGSLFYLCIGLLVILDRKSREEAQEYKEAVLQAS